MTPFVPTPWLGNRHAQTLWRALIGSRPAVTSRIEVFDLPDGDVVELVWATASEVPGRPLLLLLHGLEGSVDSRYARTLLAEGAAAGFRTVLLHFRGTAGRVNRLARSYHSGDTGDVAAVAVELGQRFPGVPLTAIGISLGGNVLLKWLGESGPANPLAAAAVACVPCDLAGCAAALSRGFSRLYQHYLVRLLRASARRKAHLLDVAPEEWRRLTSFRAFDARLTAPLNGFASVDDYYARASCIPWLPRITVPTLLLAAADDPFVPLATVPRDLPPAVRLEIHAQGGHVGFLTGWWPRPCLERHLVLRVAGLAGIPREWPTLPAL